jgi:CBS domain-containing protein
MFATRFSKRGTGERALEAMHGGVEQGRRLMSRVVEQGRAAMEDVTGDRGMPVIRGGMRGVMGGLGHRREALRSEPAPSRWLWLLVGGAAGAAAMLASRRVRGAGAWGARRVEDVMVRDVETIDASASLMQAAQRMRDANVGVLPVVEAGRLRGVLTDRDIVVRGVARGTELASLRAGEVASRDLVAARPDWSLQQALDTMALHQIGRLPVVDDSDRVLGIVTLSSLALRSARQDEALDTAKEVSRRSARAV